MPVEVGGRRPFTVSEDEHPKPDTTIETSAALRPAFAKEGTVTVGNAFGINDGRRRRGRARHRVSCPGARPHRRGDARGGRHGRQRARPDWLRADIRVAEALREAGLSPPTSTSPSSTRPKPRRPSSSVTPSSTPRRSIPTARNLARSPRRRDGGILTVQSPSICGARAASTASSRCASVAATRPLCSDASPSPLQRNDRGHARDSLARGLGRPLGQPLPRMKSEARSPIM